MKYTLLHYVRNPLESLQRKYVDRRLARVVANLDYMFGDVYSQAHRLSHHIEKLRDSVANHRYRHYVSTMHVYYMLREFNYRASQIVQAVEYNLEWKFLDSVILFNKDSTQHKRMVSKLRFVQTSLEQYTVEKAHYTPSLKGFPEKQFMGELIALNARCVEATESMLSLLKELEKRAPHRYSSNPSVKVDEHHWATEINTMLSILRDIQSIVTCGSNSVATISPTSLIYKPRQIRRGS